ncbi:ABC transporter ATP-binding protein [Bradyrhizobium sp. CCGUVB1N3]|uniref:ABC transporter ATP-binding protein n=1 Tax=Bradyrhizobium sp. CCGUVB1N3 TaxID=2949629 RepID=UPI0020B2F586|nr:ABC transporter ATP-binding protein [Bradyrhizobium sp. CCGUVB1N3]MCP3476210.1 ABC transporter ATP-binding protein [Bradyrhizobium sp. CCGUVB1N3]
MRGVVKVHRDGQGGTVAALNGLDVSIAQGEFVAAVGPSGSGKSTFLGIAGCLDRATSGEYRLGDLSVSGMDHDQLAWLRAHRLGFVFQSFQLLNHLSVIDNVVQPMLYTGRPKRERNGRAMACLERVGLAQLSERRPYQLSGGQQQRVAIARALANEPAILFADEPTAALDPDNKAQVLDLIDDLNAGGLTVVLVTHDSDAARRAHRLIHFRAGRAFNVVSADQSSERLA